MWRLWKRCCWTTYRWKSLPTFKWLMETVWRIHILNGNDSQSQWLVGFLVWCVDASRNVVCQRMRHKKVVFPQIPRVDKHECIMWSHTIESRTSNTFIEMTSTSIPPRWTFRKIFLRYLKRSHQLQKQWLLRWQVEKIRYSTVRKCSWSTSYHVLLVML